jgi:4-hydroxy-tetrahydrodipicolinate reductase
VIKVVVHGAAGRMGRSVIDVLLDQADAGFAAAIEHVGHAALGQDASLLAGRSAGPIKVSSELDAALSSADVVIDFSTVRACRELLASCLTHARATVIATTGLDAQCQEAIVTLAQRAPVVVAPNYSVGVNVLLALARRAVELVGEDFDLEIVEMHHKRKVDAPSGTAAQLLEVVAAARGLSSQGDAVHGRRGELGARGAREIGVHALRGGDVVGDHTLVLAGPGERLELTHRAHTRQIFARGAVLAARWAAQKPPGLYGMADVLGIR